MGVTNYHIGPSWTPFDVMRTAVLHIRRHKSKAEERTHMYSLECLKLQLLAIDSELNSHLTLGCIIITLRIYYVIVIYVDWLIS